MAEPPAKRAKRTDSSTMWDPPERSETIETVITDEKNGDIDLGQRIGARRGGIEAVHGKEIENEIEMEGDTGTVVTEEMTETRRTESEVQVEKDTDHGEVYESNDPPSRRHHSRSRSPNRSKPTPTRARSRPRTQPSKPPPQTASGKDPTADTPPAKSPLPPTSPSRKDSPSLQGVPAAPSAPHISKPRTNGTSSTPPPSSSSAKSTNKLSNPAKVPVAGTTKNKDGPSTTTTDPAPMEVDSDPEVQLMKEMMGFITFKSTKNKKVPGNNVYGVRKEKKTEYRQYMNRVGGFNRPLSPSR
ncbi:hypothetical protein MMC31_001877 [Peltigera leucophlebia]|nr:hypothetical protein [Peltigera leucophlebia]